MSKKPVEVVEATELPTDLPSAEPGQRLMRFVVTHEVQDEHRGTARATIYESGQVYALSAESAQHFEGRGKAEPV